MFDLLMQGFSNAMTSTNILFLFVGVLWGNMLGVLPGIGPVQGIALLIPLTFKLPATTALLMLAGIYYGAQYGGSTTAILLNIPGETSAIMTAVEGYPLNLQGRGGAALGMSAFSSFIAGTLSVVGLMLLPLHWLNLASPWGLPKLFPSFFALLRSSVALVVIRS